jgi:hypothetical protein
MYRVRPAGARPHTGGTPCAFPPVRAPLGNSYVSKRKLSATGNPFSMGKA